MYRGMYQIRNIQVWNKYFSLQINKTTFVHQSRIYHEEIQTDSYSQTRVYNLNKNLTVLLQQINIKFRVNFKLEQNKIKLILFNVAHLRLNYKQRGFL